MVALADKDVAGMLLPGVLFLFGYHMFRPRWPFGSQNGYYTAPQSPEMGSSQLGQLIRNEQSVSNLTISCLEGEYIFIYSYRVAHRKEKMKRVRQTQGEGDMQPQGWLRIWGFACKLA